MSGSSDLRRLWPRRAWRSVTLVAALLGLSLHLSCAGARPAAWRPIAQSAGHSSVAAEAGPSALELAHATGVEEPSFSPGHASSVEHISSFGATHVTSNERDAAIGLLLDSSPAPGAIERGLVIAEALQRCYGADSNGTFPNREETARRAKLELLDRMELSEEEIRAMAVSLGYSLDPEACGNTCDNVRALAVIELEKRRLLAIAAAAPGSCATGGDRLPSSDHPPH